jgi:hypothetical protein
MTVERKSADQFHVFGEPGLTPEMCAEQDFRIRSGLCPNGCGLMHLDSDPNYLGQDCPKCKFWTNARPDEVTAT